jgi:uncharacterized protein (TIGR02231 family)
LLGVNEEIVKINENLSILQDKYNQGINGNSIYTLDVYVSYQLSAYAGAEIQLSYIVNNCYWYPVYDSRASLKNHDLIIEYYAMVYQDTGENWDDINITLSTARPDLSGEIPEIYPWEINFYQNSNSEQLRSKKMSKEVDLDSAMLEDAASPAPCVSKAYDYVKEDENVAQVESQGLSIEYAIASKATIISGKKDTRVTISSGIDFKPELKWTIVPRMDVNAFLTAKIKNNSIFTFLAGEMNLYVDDSFIGKSSFSMINPSEEFELSLGRDPRIKAEFKLDNVEKSKSFSKNREKRHYIIEISNHTKETIELIAKDIFPKSIQANKVFVKIIKITPDTKDIESGSIYKWTLRIEKESKAKIIEEWEIEYPDGGYLTGL